MRRRTLLLAVGLSAFLTGASLDYRLRRPGPFQDCFCMSAKCRVVFIAEHPLTALRHPLQSIELLRTARGLD